MSKDSELLRMVERIALDVASRHANSVDRDSRFPAEAIAALQEIQALAAPIPSAFGGLECSVSTLSSICTTLGRACASTAMIVAMHFIQIFTIARHAQGGEFFADFLRAAAGRQRLIASGTSEVGSDGDLAKSTAPVVHSGSRFRIDKQCTTVSYARAADGILLTARRAPEAASSDQSLVLLLKDDYELTQMGEWDALGMRGTCSPPFRVAGVGRTEQILPIAFRDIASATMVPVSHLMWCSVWQGIAESAVAIARSRCRNRVGQPAAARLARATLLLQLMSANLETATRDYEEFVRSGQARPPVHRTLATNNLKLAASELLWSVCHECLAICGIGGYLNTTKFSLGRHLRDALSAPLMIGNDRIAGINAGLAMLVEDPPRS